MDQLFRAIGAIVGAVAMGFECLLWGGVDLARRVVSREYIGGMIALTATAIFIPLGVLIFGLWIKIGGFVVFSGFLFLFFACAWLIASIPAALLVGAGIEIKEFFERRGRSTYRPPAPTTSPTPTSTKKK